MRLATLRTTKGTTAVRRDGDTYTEIQGFADVGALLAHPDWATIAAEADGAQHPAAEAQLASVVTAPSKIVCVGLNYRTHILEMGRDLPEYPTLFSKYAETLIGAHDDIELPAEDAAIDWEAELAVIIGTGGRRISEADAAAHIAGYSVCNDVSMRSWQFRTKEWLQGKNWEHSTPLGPELVTPDEWTPGGAIRTVVDGEVMQEASTGDLVHGPEFLISYISTMITLNPGDVIITGTPGGVGHARKPQRYLTEGQVVETSIEGLGTLRNRATATVGAAV
ncbi:fumarylacetoacetate hydrolase family protein [Arthrobacter sp. I2-34]|uniref:Fumarylacetoacetate hydrolase family protein n=1 Tax=Arthrobacter hankyongi TaxID=2904801 RepID=A0ABS9LDH2_9MICC|nr:fumarylacetoacetate hydrolase family protein [Arthrobacter hankyongi]MCG2624472.1 fumarylacetoacetate hydrolase family protein [Arthrobacter hankyongi]